MKYTVRSRRSQQIRRMLAFKDGAEVVEYDFKPWADETVTSVEWILKSGNAGISNQALSGNVATALVTTNEIGGSIIQLKATAGTNVYITTLYVYAKETNRRINDYGLCYG